MKGIEEFARGVVMICVIVMRGVGVIDDLFTGLMMRIGMFDPHGQLYILLGLMVFYVVLALRAVGGMLGWVMLFFAVLVLLHRTVPALSDAGLGVAVPLQASQEPSQ